MKSTILVLAVISLTGISYANPADIDNSGAVGPTDLAIFVAAWGSDDTPTANWNPDCDIANPADGVIDEKDWGVLSANWLWTAIPPAGMVWVYIDDDGSGMKNEFGNPVSQGGFTGEMSKYKTTNARYCQYLNAAKASGAITVSGNYVVGASGPYPGQNYYRLDGSGYTYNGATNGGAARINWTGSFFTVDSGFDNHPVTYVTWYGSTAFAAYYGWRLPTEWEWQAAADYDGTYTYGHGPGTITNSLANYYDSTHPYGTTVVGAYGSIHGYGMCDMAGNAWEWTSSFFSSYRIFRGGCWYCNDDDCTVSSWSLSVPYGSDGSIGFRVCR